jgi:hypothetical protein
MAQAFLNTIIDPRADGSWFGSELHFPWPLVQSLVTDDIALKLHCFVAVIFEVTQNVLGKYLQFDFSKAFNFEIIMDL